MSEGHDSEMRLDEREKKVRKGERRRRTMTAE